MIMHTLLMSFTEPTSAQDIDRVLADIDTAARGTGTVQTVASARHIAVPGEDAIPAFIASAVLQFGLPDLDALGALFTAPAVEQVFDELRERVPFTVAWVNHEPLT